MLRYLFFLSIFLLLVSGVVLVAAQASPSQVDTYTLQRSALSSTSAQTLQGDGYNMVATTAGEPNIGDMSGTGYTLDGGYIHETVPMKQEIFLPLVTR